ncbi:MAG TPA: hypothetical protein EYN67_10485 [Flavobacteriales bacterium]|nr:hypothetical protein [Flavobacteriales bacterium]
MANLFFKKEKSPKQEAINALLLMISNYYDGRYEVLATSDDGGAMLEVQIEVPDVSGHLSTQAPTFPFFDIWPIWMGWRVVIAKVPPGYIDAITLAAESDY